jgi:alpha-beta hydrolase superfamily lysophospholipase
VTLRQVNAHLAAHAESRPVSQPRARYAVFVLLCAVIVVAAAIPIIASDIFRQPYSPVWDTIHRTLDRLQLSYNPPGGGAPPQWPKWWTPVDANIYYRSLTLTTADGLDLAAWYVPALEPGAPSILLTHGLLGSKWGMLRLVPWLHDAGYNVMLFDFRGHGGSDPRPTTIGPEEVLDVQAALDWLEAEGVGDRVAGLGMSLGAAALVNTAVQDDRLDALILDSLFADWGDTDFAKGYRLSPDWLVPGVPDPEDLMPRIHVPVFIIGGTADILTHEEHAHRLFEAANEPKELWINDSGHAWSAWTYPDLFQQKVLDFLDQALSD